MRISIYIATQKEHEFPKNSSYKPLFLGKSAIVADQWLHDDTGDSISDRNPFYSELTGQYWIWKNDKENDIVGLCHYRRFLWTYKNPWWLCRRKFATIADCERFLRIDSVSSWLEHHDVILPRPEAFHRESLKEQFVSGLGAEGYAMMEASVRRVAPAYAQTFADVLDRQWGYFTNLLICRKELFDRYSAWLFSILQDIEDHMDKTDRRNLRILGHCSERLLNVYVAHHRLRAKEVPMIVIAGPGEPLSRSTCLDARCFKRRHLPWMVKMEERLWGRSGKKQN